MKIALGTVQFGLDYGISNPKGKVAFNEVKKILNLATLHEIAFLDTAMGYGTSEKTLGDYKRYSKNQNFKIITKIPSIRIKNESISNMLDKALLRLSCEKIYALLFHDASDLNLNTYKEISSLKNRGKIQKIGVSVYSPEQAFFIANNFDIDLIQLPLNVFDQRFIESGCLTFLKSKNIEIHTRSVFLQGLLLQPFNDINSYFTPYLNLIKKFHDFCSSYNLSSLDVAMSLIHSVSNIDKVVIGVCSKVQLIEILKSYEKTADIELDLRSFLSTEQKLINPSLWNIEK
jgi:aryl-alcohol dehydrogenase-like predicted oxidoreductase